MARKAKRWDEKHMAQLKLQKEKLQEDMKELVKKSRKGSELATVESQIKGLENRLKYSQQDLEKSRKSIRDCEKKVTELEAELNAVGVSAEAEAEAERSTRRTVAVHLCVRERVN